ncbi:MAG: sulfotransferase family protein [Proteobacteria bacterium]|nr:sulfotransferase family protein [Pseudomonadota bacterium]
MALKVIGTGLGRTGTMSLKLALEQLGLAPCHHMVEVFMHPESVPLWVEAGRGNPDWDAIFGDYQAMVDHPGCKFWRELMDYYPDAKLIHTVRDPERWFESTQATIFNPGGGALNPPEPMRDFFAMVMAEYEGQQNDHDYMIEHFKRHTEDVLAGVPPERLLVFEASQGWEPLCAFLGVPVPDTPYPRENSTAEFQARVSAGTMADPAAVKAEMDKARAH